MPGLTKTFHRPPVCVTIPPTLYMVTPAPANSPGGAPNTPVMVWGGGNEGAPPPKAGGVEGVVGGPANKGLNGPGAGGVNPGPTGPNGPLGTLPGPALAGPGLAGAPPPRPPVDPRPPEPPDPEPPPPPGATAMAPPGLAGVPAGPVGGGPTGPAGPVGAVPIGPVGPVPTVGVAGPVAPGGVPGVPVGVPVGVLVGVVSTSTGVALDMLNALSTMKVFSWTEKPAHSLDKPISATRLSMAARICARVEPGGMSTTTFWLPIMNSSDMGPEGAKVFGTCGIADLRMLFLSGPDLSISGLDWGNRIRGGRSGCSCPTRSPSLGSVKMCRTGGV